MFFNPLLLGVAAAIDPVLIGSVAFMLTRRNPKRLLAVYLVGGFGISMIAGVVVLFVLKDVGANKHSSAPPEIEIAVGALLVVAAVLIGTGLSARLRERVQARRETHHGGGLAGGTPAPATDPSVIATESTATTKADVTAVAEAQSDIGEKLDKLEGVPVLRKLVPRLRQALEAESPWVAWIAGVAIGMPSAYYLAAIAVILKSGGAPATQVAAVLVFNLALFAMVWIPLAGYIVAPAATKTRVESLSAWAHTHRRLVIAVVAGLIGAYLIIVGITKL
jgi:hypothetical protein